MRRDSCRLKLSFRSSYALALHPLLTIASLVQELPRCGRPVTMTLRKPMEGMGSVPTIHLQGIGGGGLPQRPQQPQQPSRNAMPPAYDAPVTASYNNNGVFKLGGGPAPPNNHAPPAREIAQLGISGPSIGGGGASYKESFDAAHGTAPAAVDSRLLTDAQRRAGYLEFTFSMGSLGMTLEELFEKSETVSVVNNVVAGGQADELGVNVGDKLVGLEGKSAISHAYAVVTIKNRSSAMRIRLLRR